MPIIANGNTGITAPALSANAVTVGTQGITFNDASTQTTAAVPAVPQIQVFTSNGTFSIPPTTTRVKVTVVGGGAGAPGGSLAGGGAAGAGASGGSSSFGSYFTSTGGTVSAPGTSPGANLDLSTSPRTGDGTLGFGNYGSVGPSAPIGNNVFVTTFIRPTHGRGGAGVRVINAPFPVTSVPITIGPGGGGGGGGGVPAANAGSAASGANGGAGGTHSVAPLLPGGGGGGAGGATAGTGGPSANFANAGQSGNSTSFGHGGLGIGPNENSTGGGPGGFSGVVIVEY